MIDRRARLGAAVLVLGGVAGGCGGGEPVGTGGHGTGGGSGLPDLLPFTGAQTTQIDVLLTIDNSRSMADKQAILAAAVPDLVAGLVNPPCVDDDGVPAAQQPAGPLDTCPAPGTHRRARPVTDIHVGVITSSLGSVGGDACPNSETTSCPGGATNTSTNDLGHLVSRAGPCADAAVGTYQGLGFLAWDPLGKDAPPGEKSLGAIQLDPGTGAVATVTPGLVPSIKDLVVGAGQIGCGYEASLESWYRFLVDPDPYASIIIDPSSLKATQQGVDTVLLQQRHDFLRPGSVLAIVGLTDEDDCSLRDSGYGYLAASLTAPMQPGQPFRMPKARSECATDPNDKCCFSCAQAAPASCPPEPGCGPGAALDAKDDDPSLRCWDQKRRFGMDLLQPIDRYVTGLTQQVVPNRQGALVPNPIFAGNLRDPSLVFLTYIVGVPWQDLARDPKDPKKGFKDANELAMITPTGHSTWDYLIGMPDFSAPPLDPHMVASTTPRLGQNPLTGDTIAPPSTSPGPGSDAISGHEHTPALPGGTQIEADALQYACIFPLPVARDCSDPSAVGCDCADPQNDSPLCEPDPAHGGARTKQVRAKAYPGTRQLTLLKVLGPQGLAGSICPVQLDDPAAADYGYRPAIQALLDRLAPQLSQVCLPRELHADAMGQVACTVLEGHATGQHDAAACDAFCAQQPGRTAVPASEATLRAAALANPNATLRDVDCFCAIPQLGGGPSEDCHVIKSPLAACQCESTGTPVVDGNPVDGWCYVDADTDPPTGNPDLVGACPPTERRTLRFVGAGHPEPNTLVFAACSGP